MTKMATSKNARNPPLSDSRAWSAVCIDGTPVNNCRSWVLLCMTSQFAAGGAVVSVVVRAVRFVMVVDQQSCKACELARFAIPSALANQSVER